MITITTSFDYSVASLDNHDVLLNIVQSLLGFVVAIETADGTVVRGTLTGYDDAALIVEPFFTPMSATELCWIGTSSENSVYVELFQIPATHEGSLNVQTIRAYQVDGPDTQQLTYDPVFDAWDYNALVRALTAADYAGHKVIIRYWAPQPELRIFVADFIGADGAQILLGKFHVPADVRAFADAINAAAAR